MPMPKGKLYFGSDDGQFLCANGRVSQFTAKDLPPWYVHGRYWKRFGYLTAKGVKHLYYRHPRVEFINHAMRDDSLYVSFDKPIVVTNTKPFINIEGYFIVFGGWDIVEYLRAVKKYSPKVDTGEIEAAIQERLRKFVECWPDEHESDYLRKSGVIDGLFDLSKAFP